MPLIQDFLALAQSAQLPFFSSLSEWKTAALDYLPKENNIHKEDFQPLGYHIQHERIIASYYIWHRLPDEPIENQPIVMAVAYNYTPIGVVARDFKSFLSMLAYPQSLRRGLINSYEYHWKLSVGQAATAPSGILDWELKEALTEDKREGRNGTEQFLAFLQAECIDLCTDVYAQTFAALSAFDWLDSNDTLFQLSKNFPQLQMPDIIAAFYSLLLHERVSLPDFEDDASSHVSQSALVPHFVSQDLLHHFVKLGVTGTHGYYAIWRIFPKKKLEDNPIVYLDSEASPVAVLARNFQEFICIAWLSAHSIIYDVESGKSDAELEETYNEAQMQAYRDKFVESNQADEDYELAERSSLYFSFIEQYCGSVADKNPLHIIRQAYREMPNLLQWLKVKMPNQWSF